MIFNFLNSSSHKAISTLFCSIALACFSLPIYASLYKWVDENGQTRYGDQLPPKFSNKKHQQLDAEGRIIETKEAGKSPKKLRKERKIAEDISRKKKKVEKEKEERRIKQARQDKVLLLTFNSEDDVFYARDQRLQVLDSKITLFKKNKAVLLKKQQTLNIQADNLYRSKEQKVPGGMQQKLDSLNRRVDLIVHNIALSEKQRAKVVITFEANLVHFRDLKERQQKNKNDE